MLSLQDIRITLEDTNCRVELIDSFSLDVSQGQSVCIIGESGAGKSSILFASVGLLSQAMKVSGAIYWRDTNLLQLSELELQKIRGRKIGFIFQNSLQSFDPLFKVGQQFDEILSLYFPKESRKERTLRKEKLLAAVKLPIGKSFYSMYPHELSGGMVQRLSIAFVLAAGPELLLADELTSALDKELETEVMELLCGFVKERKMGLLWVTHDLSLAERFAEKVVVLRAGKMIEVGRTEEVMNFPREEYTKQLLLSIPQGERGAL